MVLAALIQGCGGGGGGGGGPGSTPEATLSVASSSIAFEAEQGETAAPRVVTGSLTDVQSPVTVVIAHTNIGIAHADFLTTSTTTGQLTVTPRPSAQMAPGIYTDTITVSACLDAACTRQTAGSPRQVSVSYSVRRAVPPATLDASERGIAFAEVPGRQRLSHRITVTEARGAATGWSATSSATWLSVTPAGAIGGTLLLSADAAALSDGLHLATVTLKSSNAGAARDETVRVGLYKSSAAPAARLAEPLATTGVPFGPQHALSDPVRPLAYFARGDTVVAQHFHSGARTGTITLPSVQVAEIAISDDGRTLYVLDGANTGITLIDLDSFQVAGRFPPSNAIRSTETRRMAYARVSGRPVLVLNRGLDASGGGIITPIIDAESGQPVGSVTGYNGWDYTAFAAARGGVVYAADKGVTGGSLQTTRLQLRANSLGHVFTTVTQTPSYSVPTTLLDIAAHPDGSKVLQSYYGQSGVLEALFDGTTLAWTGQGPPNPAFSSADVEFLADGRYFAVSGDTLRLYGPDKVLQFQWVEPPGAPSPLDGESGSIRVSSDGLRLLGNDLFIDLPR